MPLEVIV